MSSCIAVACEKNTVLVTVTDRKWTSLYSSFEESLKAAYVAQGWIALVAGDNFAIAGERVMHEMRASLKDEAPGSISAIRMAGVLDTAWNVTQTHIATTSVLGVLELTMTEFMKSRQKLGDEKFAELLSDIQEKKRLKLELLVCGFDDEGVPVILVRSDDIDAAFDVSRTGRAAIGSGHVHAEASLASHKYDCACCLSEAVYQACTAKFMSEQADGVGEGTAVLCLRPNGPISLLSTKAVDAVRQMWERETRPKMPTKETLHSMVGQIIANQWV